MAKENIKDLTKSIKAGVEKLRRYVHTAGEELGRGIDQHLTNADPEVFASEPEIPEWAERGGSEPLDEALTQIHRLATPPHHIGAVVKLPRYVRNGKELVMARISVQGRVIEVPAPKNLEIASGSAVRLNPQTQQIIGLAEAIDSGVIASVREVGEDFLTVETNGVTRQVRAGVLVALSRGDRVVLDEQQLVAIKALPKFSEQFEAPASAVTFDDVVGHEEAKRVLRKAVHHDPHADPISKHYRRKRAKGVFIFGPPGCGKTMLVSATVAEVEKRHGARARSSGCLQVDGPELLSKYVGDTEAALRGVFEEADRHEREHGYPAVVTFEEAESLFSKRGSGTSADMEKTVVPTLLTLINRSNAFVLLLTNRADVIDPAVIRDGRFNKQVYVGRPTRENAEHILSKNFGRYPLTAGMTPEALAKEVAEEFYDPKLRVIDEGLRLADGTEVFFTLANIVNGAMLARLADDAADLAEDRDRKDGTQTGITFADARSALRSLYEDKKRLEHADELDEFFRSMKDRLPKETLIQKSIP